MDRTFVGESSFCLLMCWWGQRLPFLTIFVPYMEHTFFFLCVAPGSDRKYHPFISLLCTNNEPCFVKHRQTSSGKSTILLVPTDLSAGTSARQVAWLGYDL